MTGERARSVPVPPGFDPASVVLTFRVPNELDGQRLDRFLEWAIPRLSRERARLIIDKCATDASGRRRAPFERVRAKETVLIVRERFVEPEAPRTFEVLYEDDAMLVLDKPAGLPVHPSATFHKNTLTAVLRERYPENTPHLAHRLDKETSGIVVCGRPGSDDATLKKQFELRQIEKAYLAIVRGVVEADEGRIALRIGRRIKKDAPSVHNELSGPEAPRAILDTAEHLMMDVREDGQEAVTQFRVLERAGDRTLVKLWPETGRQHQLRVHLSAIGHPILGDKLYGPDKESAFVEIVEAGGMSDAMRARLGHDRHALHAAELTLSHPRTGERMTFVAPLPPDLLALMEAGRGPAGR